MRALICLDSGNCATRFVQEIASCSGVPPAYLAKIFKKLVDAGILKSNPGPGGGTRLARSAAAINQLQIAEAVDGSDWIGDCLLGFEACDDLESCPTYDFWKIERRRIADHLSETTLADVSAFGRARVDAAPLKDCSMAFQPNKT